VDRAVYFLKMVSFQGIGEMTKDKVKVDSEFSNKNKS